MVRRVRCEDGVLVVRVSGGGEVRLRVVVHGAGWRAGSGEAWFPVLEGLAAAAGGWCEGLMYAVFSLGVRRELVERLLDRGCSVEHLEVGLGALLFLRHALVERIGGWLGQCGWQPHALSDAVVVHVPHSRRHPLEALPTIGGIAQGSMLRRQGRRRLLSADPELCWGGLGVAGGAWRRVGRGHVQGFGAWAHSYGGLW